MVRYTQFIEVSAAYKVNVISIGQADVSSEHGKKTPLYVLDLVLKEGQVGLNYAYDKMIEMPIGLFDKAIQSLEDIPQLEPLIMEDLFWSSKQNLQVKKRPILAHPTWVARPA